MKVIAIYPGRFQPFHLGHKSVYDVLVRQFGVENVYIATSDKVDPPRSPFNFAEKQQIIAATGVDRNRVVQTRDPYKAIEITSQYDPQDTKLLFAVSAKDMAEDPRFKSWTKRDGSPAYFQPAPNKVSEMEDFDRHGYIFVVPTLDFKVDGKPMRSATEFRKEFAAADEATKAKMTRGILGTDDPSLVKLLASRITEGKKMASKKPVGENFSGAFASVTAPLGATRRRVKEVIAPVTSAGATKTATPTKPDAAAMSTLAQGAKTAGGSTASNTTLSTALSKLATGSKGPALSQQEREAVSGVAKGIADADSAEAAKLKALIKPVAENKTSEDKLVKPKDKKPTPADVLDHAKRAREHTGQKPIKEYKEVNQPTDGELLLLMRKYRMAKVTGKPIASVMRQSDIYKLVDAEKAGRLEKLKYQTTVEAKNLAQQAAPKTGDTFTTSKGGTVTRTARGLKHTQSPDAGKDINPGNPSKVKLDRYKLHSQPRSMFSGDLSEAAGQSLNVEQLATISDEALDRAYHYGRSSPGNTFGWQANLKSAAFAKKIIDSGITDIEKISDAIHRGWNVTAQAFVKNPMQFDDSKTMAPEKLQAKLAQREKLMTQQYAQLPEDEKEKDRVVARALLQAITGDKPGVTESSQRVDRLVTRSLRIMRGGTPADAIAALKTVLGEMEYNERPQFYDFFIKQMVDMYGKQGNLKEFAPGNGGGESGRWYTDDQMTDLVGDGWWNDLDISGDISKQEMIQEAQAWLDDQGYGVHVLNCKVNDDDMEWYIEGSFQNSRFAKKGVAEGLKQMLRKADPTIKSRLRSKADRLDKEGDEVHQDLKSMGMEPHDAMTRNMDPEKYYRNADRYRRLANKKEGVAEGGPFSYGKPPRKGSVADLAAQKRKEQDKKTPPIEPRDQMVGNAKVTKDVKEEWSQKYKNSINCSHPKGFSQKAHCAGKHKKTESIVSEMVCPDCGMCESHGGLGRMHKKSTQQHVAESFHDSVTFEIDSENAFNHVMGRFNSRIDWNGEYMVAPRQYWGAIQELAHEAGGEATEISDEHSMAEDMRMKSDFRRETDAAVADFLARGGEIETVPPNRVRVKPGQSLASKHIGSKRETGRIVGKDRRVHGNKPVVNVSEVNDYFRRRKDEEDRIAGVKPPAKRTPQQTDYQKRRNREQQVGEAKQKPSAQERFNNRLKTKHGIDLDAMERQWAERTKKIEAEIAALRKQEKQVSESYYQTDEGWKTAVAGAALAGAAALGGGGAQAQTADFHTPLTQPTVQQTRADYIKKLPQVDSVELNGDQVSVKHNGKDYQGFILQANDPRPRFGPNTEQARVDGFQIRERGLSSYVVYFVNDRAYILK
jgi:hypothetical protein